MENLSTCIYLLKFIFKLDEKWPIEGSHYPVRAWIAPERSRFEQSSIRFENYRCEWAETSFEGKYDLPKPNNPILSILQIESLRSVRLAQFRWILNFWDNEGLIFRIFFGRTEKNLLHWCTAIRPSSKIWICDLHRNKVKLGCLSLALLPCTSVLKTQGSPFWFI